jgi:hypothetical protein
MSPAAERAERELRAFVEGRRLPFTFPSVPAGWLAGWPQAVAM